ncbi:MAG: NAD-dependent epimerase/dehydratase family protein, partial [Aeoliella sp.]
TALVNQGGEVVVLDNFSTGKRENIAHLDGKITLVEGDLLDRKTVSNVVQDVEVVYHQAALASVPRSVANPFDTHQACTTGTLNVLDLSRSAGVRRVVYAGSSSAYGNQPYSSKREADFPQPLSPYAAAKLAGEYYCKAFCTTYGLETVTIRYFNVFGPRQDPKGEYSAVIPKFVTAMLSGEQPTIFGDGLQSRDFTYIENVVRANLAAATASEAPGRIINVACGHQFTLLHLVKAINKILETNIEPRFAERRPGDVKDSLADISVAQKLLGYEPAVGFEEGLRQSIEYYRTLSI